MGMVLYDEQFKTAPQKGPNILPVYKAKTFQKLVRIKIIIIRQIFSRNA